MQMLFNFIQENKTCLILYRIEHNSLFVKIFGGDFLAFIYIDGNSLKETGQQRRQKRATCMK